MGLRAATMTLWAGNSRPRTWKTKSLKRTSPKKEANSSARFDSVVWSARLFFWREVCLTLEEVIWQLIVRASWTQRFLLLSKMALRDIKLSLPWTSPVGNISQTSSWLPKSLGWNSRENCSNVTLFKKKVPN